MASYYINADNGVGGGIYPYDSIEVGAYNFYSLLTSVAINDGDIIYVATPSGKFVDDSSHIININNKVTIIGSYSDTPNIVKLPSTGIGMNLNMSGITVKNCDWYSDAYNGNSLININANDVIIQDCEFAYNAGGIVGYTSCINVYSSYGVNIKNNIITTPLKSNTSLSTGIYVNNSSYCDVSNNTVKMIGSYSQGIAVFGVCDYNTIGYNVVGVFSEDDASDTTILYGIIVSENGNYNKIYNNAIGLAGASSVGIQYGITNFTGINVEINNNYIHMYENDFGSTGILIPFKLENIVSYFEIVNNIIEYTGNDNNGLAMNISIQHGVIDYNDIYNMQIVNIFYRDREDLTISFGKYNIFSNPRLFYSEAPKLDKYNIENFYCYKTSECIGSGYLHHNIGVGVDPSLTSQKDKYINIIDTVTYNYGFGTVTNKPSYNTFFNSVFIEHDSEFDRYYRGSIDYPYTNVELDDTSNYPSYFDISLGVYRNQFDFIMTNPTTFPFSVGDPFYKKDLTYVCANKDKLKPFDGIECPPNPGYGYGSGYKDYEEGLWGYLRVKKENTCGLVLNSCIIQDTIKDVIRYQDTIDNTDIWVQDMITPPCITS